ncbi:hypothetical protein GLI01_27020 [Gluconacetobacter liquefaciens]|nr:hypothetical protein GLI01_27020 [Gluconacetobacter liquefaciens]
MAVRVCDQDIAPEAHIRRGLDDPVSAFGPECMERIGIICREGDFTIPARRCDGIPLPKPQIGPAGQREEDEAGGLPDRCDPEQCMIEARTGRGVINVENGGR